MSIMPVKDMFNSSARDSLSRHEPLSVVGICVDDETWRFLKLFAESLAMIQLRLCSGDYRVQDHESVLEYLGDPTPEICLVDFDKDRRSAASVAERIHASAPETAIFAVSHQSQPDSIIEAMRSGCSEYLVKPLNREQLVTAIGRVAARRRDKKESSKAQLLGFIGAKGGCGVTTVITQFGALLANSYSRKTLIVDLHPEFGDAALYLGLTKPRYHFFELLENTERMDADFLQSFLMHHSSGLDLIPAPDGSEPPREVIPGAMSQTCDFLRLRYEFVLVDLPPGLNDDNLELLRDCDQLYLVTVAEVSAVRNLVRQIGHLRRKDIAPEKIQVILNRHQNRSAVTDAQIEKVIGQKIFWRVPNQYAQVMKTIHEGDPVAQLSNSEVARNLNEWAGAIGRKPGTEEKKSGILGLWNR